jgi:hypothetical protein
MSRSEWEDRVNERKDSAIRIIDSSGNPVWRWFDREMQPHYERIVPGDVKPRGVGGSGEAGR